MSEQREPWQGVPDEPETDVVPHPVAGRMADSTPNDLYDFFRRRPPTTEQADFLAWEEAQGRNRREVYTLLEYFRRKP